MPVPTQGPHSWPLITKAAPFPSFSPLHTSALSPSPDTVLCILRFDSYTRLVKNENIRVCIPITKNQKASVMQQREPAGAYPTPQPITHRLRGKHHQHNVQETREYADIIGGKTLRR